MFHRILDRKTRDISGLPEFNFRNFDSHTDSPVEEMRWQTIHRQQQFHLKTMQASVCVIWRGYGNLPVDPTQCRQTIDVGRDFWQAKDGLTVTSWLMVPNLNNNTFHGLRSPSHVSTQLWCHHYWCVCVLACNEYMSQGDKEKQVTMSGPCIQLNDND